MHIHPQYIATALLLTLSTTHLCAKSDWAETEYNGVRTDHNLRIAMASKGFAWLSGSPADNEKLSIGKNAQFFGFVALRAESGRAANRGALGRAFNSLATPEQKALLEQAVTNEVESLDAWWNTRSKVLRILENHLYTGDAFDLEAFKGIASEFGRLNAEVALQEARAFAALEDSLSEEQWTLLKQWRADPELAKKHAKTSRVTSNQLPKEQHKQLEDLYAKSFSWLTGTDANNQVIPLGQPGQFFGFVSIRHKSGHAASRSRIAKSFLEILTKEQQQQLDVAIKQQHPIFDRFMETRSAFLNELSKLRTNPEAFDQDKYFELGESLGQLDVAAGMIEAKAYREIRTRMDADQEVAMMAIRNEYILDRQQVESLSQADRGKQLALLCAGCHGLLGQHIPQFMGPSLDTIFERKIASMPNYEYSQALILKGKNDGQWSREHLDAYLASPKSFAPGTKMEFQGLLNAEDRQAVIDYFQANQAK